MMANPDQVKILHTKSKLISKSQGIGTKSKSIPRFVAFLYYLRNLKISLTLIEFNLIFVNKNVNNRLRFTLYR
jgi:hypothetical protein